MLYSVSVQREVADRERGDRCDGCTGVCEEAGPHLVGLGEFFLFYCKTNGPTIVPPFVVGTHHLDDSGPS